LPLVRKRVKTQFQANLNSNIYFSHQLILPSTLLLFHFSRPCKKSIHFASTIQKNRSSHLIPSPFPPNIFLGIHNLITYIHISFNKLRCGCIFKSSNPFLLDPQISQTKEGDFAISFKFTLWLFKRGALSQIVHVSTRSFWGVPGPLPVSLFLKLKAKGEHFDGGLMEL